MPEHALCFPDMRTAWCELLPSVKTQAHSSIYAPAPSPPRVVPPTRTPPSSRACQSQLPLNTPGAPDAAVLLATGLGAEHRQ